MWVWSHGFRHTPIDVQGTIAILTAFLFPLGMLYIVAPRITATIYRHRKAILITSATVIIFFGVICGWMAYSYYNPRIGAAPNPYLKP